MTGLKTIDEFLKDWIVDGKAHYESVKNEYIKFLEAGGHKDIYREAQWLKDRYGNKRFADEAGLMLRSAYNCRAHKEDYSRYTAFIELMLTKEADKKKKDLMAKIEKLVGNVISANLTIGNRGDINGLIIGDAGSATIETITAGGYNIQRYHYRVLVKPIKGKK